MEAQEIYAEARLLNQIEGNVLNQHALASLGESACVPTTLSMMLRKLGIGRSPETLVGALGTTSQGTAPRVAKEFLQSLGLDVSEYSAANHANIAGLLKKMEPSDTTQVWLGLKLGQNGGHAAQFGGVLRGDGAPLKYVINDPNGGVRFTMSAEQINAVVQTVRRVTLPK